MTIFVPGDKVWFGVSDGGNHKYADEESSIQEICEITTVDGGGAFFVRPIPNDKIPFAVGKWIHFVDQKQPWYPRLVTGVAPVKIAEIIPIHTEVINYRKYETVPASMIEAAKDKGERAVRRNPKLRYWPDDKNLCLRETTVTHSDGTHTLTLDWYWVEKQEP